jgi:hypothetical protein
MDRLRNHRPKRSTTFEPAPAVPDVRFTPTMPHEYRPDALVANSEALLKCHTAGQAERWKVAYKNMMIKATFRDHLEGISEDCRKLMSKTSNLEWQTELQMIRINLDSCIDQIPRPAKPTTWNRMSGLLVILNDALQKLSKLLFVMLDAQTGTRASAGALARMGAKVAQTSIQVLTINNLYTDVFTEKSSCSGTSIINMALGKTARGKERKAPAPKAAAKAVPVRRTA